MKYPNGIDIEEGDLVWVSERLFIFRVLEILDTKEKWEMWGTDEPGVMFSSDVLGRHKGTLWCYPISCFETEKIALLTYEEERFLKCMIKLLSVQNQIEVLNSTYSCSVDWSYLPTPDEYGLSSRLYLSIGQYHTDECNSVSYTPVGTYWLDEHSYEFKSTEENSGFIITGGGAAK